MFVFATWGPRGVVLQVWTFSCDTMAPPPPGPFSPQMQPPSRFVLMPQFSITLCNSCRTAVMVIGTWWWISPKASQPKCGSCWQRLESSETRGGNCSSTFALHFLSVHPSWKIKKARSQSSWQSSPSSAETENFNQIGDLLHPLYWHTQLLSHFIIFSPLAYLQALEAPPEPVAEPSAQALVKPGWRVVQKRPERKPARTVPKIAAPPTPAPPALPEPPKQELPAWAQWRRTFA